MSRDRLEPGSILIPAFSPQRKPWNSRSFAGLGRQGERDGQRRLHGVRVQVGDQQEGDECVSWAPGFDGEHGMVGGLHGDAGQLQGATDEQRRTCASDRLRWGVDGLEVGRGRWLSSGRGDGEVAGGFVAPTDHGQGALVSVGFGAPGGARFVPDRLHHDRGLDVDHGGPLDRDVLVQGVSDVDEDLGRFGGDGVQVEEQFGERRQPGGEVLALGRQPQEPAEAGDSLHVALVGPTRFLDPVPEAGRDVPPAPASVLICEPAPSHGVECRCDRRVAEAVEHFVEEAVGPLALSD